MFLCLFQKENDGIIMVNFYNNYIGTGDVDVYTVVGNTIIFRNLD